MPVLETIAAGSARGFGFGLGPTAPATTKYVAAALSSSPYVAVYPWLSTGYGTRVGNPGTLPGSFANGIDFSPSGSHVVAALNSTPFTAAYAFSNGAFGTKITSPTLADIGTDAMFNPAGTYVAFTNYFGTSSVVVYNWSNGFGTKVADPATLVSSAPYQVRWNNAGTAIAMPDQSSPYLHAYNWSSGFGTKASGPSSSPGNITYDVAFSSTGSHVAVSIDTSPYIAAYAFTTSFGTRVANPATLPTGAGRGIEFSPSGGQIFLGQSGVSTIAYSWSSGFGSKLADPAVATTAASDIDFIESGTKVLLASDSLNSYNWSGAWGTKYSEVSVSGGSQNISALDL